MTENIHSSHSKNEEEEEIKMNSMQKCYGNLQCYPWEEYTLLI